jgi:thiamine kinase-like enzyme
MGIFNQSILIAGTLTMALFPKNDALSVAQQLLTRFLQQPARNIHCTLLAGGSEEDKVLWCFSATPPSTEYIVKLFKSQKTGTNEIAWTKFASELGIGPRFYDAGSDGRYMITAVAQDAPLIPEVANTREVITAVATALSKLHAADAPFGKESDMFKRIEAKYKGLQCSGALQELLEKGLRRVEAIKSMLRTLRVKPVPCHNDLNWGNIFVHKDTITLIDWGDAALGNPYYDVAAFFVLNVISKENERFFFEQYDKSLLAQDFWFDEMKLYKQLVCYEFALNLLLGVQKLDNGLLHAEQLPSVEHLNHYLTLLAKREAKINGQFLYEMAVAALREMLKL